MSQDKDIELLDLHHPSATLLQEGVFTYGRFEQNIKEAPSRKGLHRHDFHEVFILTSGEGIYSADFNDYPISAPCVAIAPAGTCHQWKKLNNLQGHVLALNFEFLGMLRRTTGSHAIMRPPIPYLTNLPHNLLEQLLQQVARIEEEWQTDDIYRKEVIRACLVTILIDLRRFFDTQLQPDEKLTASHQLYSHFLDYLEAHWKESSRPKDIARALRVTPDHLSSILREVTGKNASDLIAERIILEAKRLLAYSRFGIAEVAYATGFEDPSYFARFFKRKVGTSPKEFRNQFED